MRITEKIHVSSNAAKYSFCGKFLACGYFNKLTVFRTLDGIIFFSTYCSDTIRAIDWSPDSDHLLCVLAHKNKVEIFSVSSSHWICTIIEGGAGIHSAVWSPTGYHVLTIAESAVKLSVWSLVGRSVAVIEQPLMTSKDNLSFDSDGKYLALRTGSLEKYKISVFSTSSWIIRRRITCTNMINTPSIPLWSPDSNYLALWETMNLSELFLEIYSADSGEMIGSFRNVQKNRLIGICTVIWCPNSQFLLIGCHNDKIYVLNYLTWNVIYVLQHKEVIEDKNTVIYIDGLNMNESNFSILCERPVMISSSTPSAQAFRLPGINRITFSSDGLYVASQKNVKRAEIWIWSLQTFSLIAIIVLKKEVVDFKWDHSKTILLLCSKSNILALWTPTSLIKLSLSEFGFSSKIPIQEGCWRPQGNTKTQEYLIMASPFALIISGFY